MDIIPNIKYKYFSEIYSTTEVPKITPGNPKIKICQATLISLPKDLQFLKEPPIPSATVANLWLARAW